MAGQRARSALAKDERRANLVAAASRLFEQADFSAITIARVAESAGVAKGTAYLYFANKETLFLELMRAEFTAWLEVFLASLMRQRAASLVDRLPKLIAKSFADRPNIRRLMVLQHTVLEANLDETAALDFKLHMRALMDQVAAALVPRIPGWRSGDAQVYMMQTIALVIGVTQLSEPPPVIARVLASDARLQPMQIAFEPFLAQTLSALLRGSLPLTTKV